MEIYERVIELCSQFNIEKTALERACGFSQNSINKWQKSVPSIDKILKIADYFGVSVDYLLGREEKKSVMERPTSAIAENFIREFKEQMKEKAFQDIAKLYKAIKDASLKAQILTVLVAYLNRSGINTESIVGY